MTNMKINNIIYFITGFLLVTYVLYIRLFVTRLPKDLLFIFEGDINIKVIFLVLINIIINLFLLLYNVNILLNINKKKESIVKAFFNKIMFFFIDSLCYLYDSFMSFIPNIDHKVTLFMRFFYDYVKHQHEYLVLFIMYFFRFIILIIFLIEVFIFFKLDYFYKSLILILIILFIRLFVFVIRDFAANIYQLRECLTSTFIETNPDTNEPIYEYELNEGYEHLNIYNTVQQYIICNKLTGYLDRYDKYTYYYNPRVNILIYLHYFIGWTYIIIKNYDIIQQFIF